MGEIKKRKGQDLAIRALANLSDSSCKLIFVGKCTVETQEHLISLCRELRVDKRVVFTGFIDEELLRELYSSAVATVLLARQSKLSTEGFPMVIYESNACGTPLIISSGFGSDYAILNKVNGFIVPQQDIESATEAFAQALEIHSSLDSRDIMKRNCVREASRHTWSKIVPLYFDLYR